MTDESTMTATEFLASFATRVGASPPTEAETEDLLALASVAAHASERMAAPLACWLVGRRGMSPAEALALARSLG